MDGYNLLGTMTTSQTDGSVTTTGTVEVWECVLDGTLTTSPGVHSRSHATDATPATPDTASA